MGMNKRPDGRMIFSIGASRSQKTQFVLSQIKNEKRALVWDYKGEFASKFGFEPVHGKAALLKRLQEATGDARIAYQFRHLKEYDFFCRCAFNWLRQAICTIVCEEIGATTNPGKAVGYWGVLVSQALGYGVNLYAITQRAQETDKSILGNASMINICRANTTDDAEYVAKAFGLTLSQLPDVDGEMLQRYKDRSLVKSKIIYRDDKPVLTKIKAFSRTFAPPPDPK